MRRLLIGIVMVSLLVVSAADAQVRPMEKSASVTASGNTSGLTLEIQCSAFSQLAGVAIATGAATVTLDVSLDGTTWATVETLLSNASGAAVRDRMPGAPYARLRSTTTGVGLSFVLACIP